ncbi:keratin, type I cytoskeletal 19 [Colossoma macropomum]|uniref:keratin, type I cytoskeletal 19 n=1 Tax=Colossoma macropomum TaxID=42526 RepID=UPI00186472C1|nr:keratin, type I cytoskeletal 19 [Colossoma macropomum]
MSSVSSFRYSSIGSVGSGSLWAGGGGVRPSYGYSLGLGLGGGVQSHVGLGLASGLGVGVGLGLGAGGGRFGAGLAVGGGRFGLGLASGGGGGRFGFGLSSGGGGGGAGFWAGESSSIDGGLHPFTANEKVELQTLNDRLAIYLNKVKKLETANRELEEKLRGFQANKVQVTYDMQAYQDQLQPLREQFTDILRESTRLALTIDNIKLAADNFRTKYENEHAMRQVVESDVAALKALKKEYDLAIAGLTQEYQLLVKDRDTLKRTHEQEVLSLRGQMTGTLTVNVQVENTVDLSNRLADLRAEYETVVERNRKEIESWYTSKMASKDKEIIKVTDVTVAGSTEIATSRGQILNLQTELDALLLQKTYQEQRLVDVQGQKQVQLLALSRLAGGLEAELASVRDNALHQAREYQLLLSTKVQLEKEIATYKTLLEGAGDLSKIAGIRLPSSSAPALASAVPEIYAAAGAVVAAEAGGTEASADVQPPSASSPGEGEEGIPAIDAVRSKLSASSPFDALLE